MAKQFRCCIIEYIIYRYLTAVRCTEEVGASPKGLSLYEGAGKKSSFARAKGIKQFGTYAMPDTYTIRVVISKV